MNSVAADPGGRRGRSRRGLRWFVTAVGIGVLVAGCSATSSTPPASTESRVATGSPAPDQGGPAEPISVSVAITDEGCTPDRSTVTAGTVRFLISSSGNGAVSEVELLRGNRVLAERENIAPGLSGKFSVTLTPGSYRLYCPGGTGEQYQDFSVTAG